MCEDNETMKICLKGTGVCTKGIFNYHKRFTINYNVTALLALDQHKNSCRFGRSSTDADIFGVGLTHSDTWSALTLLQIKHLRSCSTNN